MWEMFTTKSVGRLWQRNEFAHGDNSTKKKLLERASCLGLLEINELVECRSREYLPHGRQSVTKPKKSFLLFFNDDFKVLWKQYINLVKNMKPFFEIFGFWLKSNCSF